MSTHKFADGARTFALQKRHGVHPHHQFQPLPLPTGQAPYHLKLEEVLPAQRMKALEQAKKLVFHTTGDTGGVQSGEAQYLVSQYLEKDLEQNQEGNKPAFFYHLGDVAYYYGETDQYYAQFYEPYKGYDAPIFAIPGNHDGDVKEGGAPSLEAFVKNFCAPKPQITPEAGDVLRHAMTQPNVYWTLQAPFATIIGLYTNVPEGGSLDQDQIDWLHSEMASADEQKALILAVHYPIYSGDKWHVGSAYLGEILDTAMRETKRVPDLVLSAHVHNYQRFTRQYQMDGRDYQIPYLVVGAGGYFHLHYEQKLNGEMVPFGHYFAHERVMLERYCDDRHGFLRLEVDQHEVRGDYITVPRPQESWRHGPSGVFDHFAYPLRVPVAP
jgi:hypothetical protein